jgi:hypothetical protein
MTFSVSLVGACNRYGSWLETCITTKCSSYKRNKEPYQAQPQRRHRFQRQPGFVDPRYYVSGERLRVEIVSRAIRVQINAVMTTAAFDLREGAPVEGKGTRPGTRAVPPSSCF